jgi:hypothetical protein
MASPIDLQELASVRGGFMNPFRPPQQPAYSYPTYAAQPQSRTPPGAPPGFFDDDDGDFGPNLADGAQTTINGVPQGGTSFG